MAKIYPIRKVYLGKDDYVFVRPITKFEFFERVTAKEIRNEKGELLRAEIADKHNYQAQLAALTLCDENGNLLFKPEEYVLLAQSMSPVKLDAIASATMKLWPGY